MKRFISVALALILILSMQQPIDVFAQDDGNASEVASGSCGDSLNWKLTTDGVLTISGTGRMYDYIDPHCYDDGCWTDDYLHSTAPWMQYREILKEVQIEDGCVYVGTWAFRKCEQIKKIVFPDSVVEVGKEALFGLYHLEVVEAQSVQNVKISNLWAEALSYKSIKLTWDEVSADVSIAISRSDYGIIATVSGDNGEFIDSDLSNKKDYTYYLRPIVNVNGQKIQLSSRAAAKCQPVDTQSEVAKPDYAAPILEDVWVDTQDTYRPGVVMVKLKVRDKSDLSDVRVCISTIHEDYEIYRRRYLDENEHIKEGEIVVPIYIQSSNRLGEYKLFSVWLSDQYGNSIEYNVDGWNRNSITIKKEFDIEFKGVLSNTNVVSELRKMQEGKTVLLTAGKETILHKELLDAIAGQDKTLVIYANKEGTLQWVINGRDITGETKDIDIKVELSTVSAEEYGGVGDTIQLKFADNGQLPFKVNFRMQSQYISAQYDLKSDMHLYYVTNNNISEENANLTVLDMGSSSWCYMDLTHNSTYYLSGVKLLKTPSITSVSNTNAGVKVSWNKVKGAKKYVVYYKKSGAKKWTKYKTTTDTTCTVERKKLKAGTKYVFTAKAVASDGNAGKVNAKGKSITWIASPKIESVKNTDSGISVKWSKVSAAKTYRVTYKVDGGKWTKYKDFTTTKCTIPSKLLKAGKNYSIRVTAITSDKTKSGIASTESIVRLKSVSNITAKKSKKGQVTVSWSKSKGAKGYYIYRKTTNGKWKRIGVVDTASKTSFIDETAKSGTKYLYAVRAYNGKSVSAIGTGVAAK